MLAWPGAARAAAEFDVRAAGAAADGRTLCTTALQSAIDRCAAAGGGIVYFPPGTYLSGTLVLRSRVTLELAAGATLLGSPNPADYPPQSTAVRSYTDNYVRQALLYGEDLEAVGLRGAGTIDGNGGHFKWKEYLNRPYGIRLVRCRDVVVEGLTLRNSGMWMQHYLACDRVRIRGLHVFNHATFNNDGLDLDGCHDVSVSDCTIDSDDDAIVLKSTLDRACENVTVTNCVLSSHANAFKLGTESNGGFRRIVFSNSVILSPRFSENLYGRTRGMCGIALETVDGGTLEDVAITNIAITGVSVPLFLRLGDRARPFRPDGPRPPVGTFRHVVISQIVASGTSRIGCSITGLPDHPIQDVTLSALSLEFDGGGERALATRAVPERAEAYPEGRMFGDLPAYGIYCRHVDGLKISDLRLRTTTPDARHALVCDDVSDLDLRGLNARGGAGAAPLLRLTNVADAALHLARGPASAGPLLRLEGAGTARLVLAGDGFAAPGRIDAAPDVPADGWRCATVPR